MVPLSGLADTGQPVLLAFVGASYADQLESRTDADIIDDLLSLLRKFFPRKTVPQPSEYLVTRWRSDPYSGGSYSHIPPGACPADYDALAKQEGSLFFCGEATTREYPNTVGLNNQHWLYVCSLLCTHNCPSLSPSLWLNSGTWGPSHWNPGCRRGLTRAWPTVQPPDEYWAPTTTPII